MFGLSMELPPLICRLQRSTAASARTDRAMKFFDWLSGVFSRQANGLTLYKRGMVRAQVHDHQGAIDCYTQATDIPNTPSEVIAMVRYNRGLVYLAIGEMEKAGSDFNGVVSMDDVSVNVKTMAKSKLARIEQRVNRKDGKKRN
jgi:tetratricopeptide (TPR) repeat protein